MFQMMLSLILITCFVWSSAADSAVNWTVDDNTLPESLPYLMRTKYYGNDEIQNAVFWAYKIQYDVISEHVGHVYDAESPLGYFNDVLILPKIRASLINSNIVFENNTVSGLMDFKSNNIVIKWSEDRVSTEIIWKELQIAGNYTFVDEWRYVTGKYNISVEDVIYQTDTPLSKNIDLYPSSAPSSAISYRQFRTTFTGQYSIPDEFSATRYFLEEVAFGHVADYVLKVTRENVTSAIRAAVQPYVQYRNRSDSHFPATSGRLDDGRAFTVSDPFIDGLDTALQKTNAVWTEPISGAVIVAVEHTLHNLRGTFNLHVGSAGLVKPLQQPGHTIEFAVDRVRLSVAYAALGPNCLCSAAVQVHRTTTWPRDGRDDDTGHLPQVAAAFANTVRDHLSVGACVAIAKTNRHGANPCPS